MSIRFLPAAVVLAILTPTLAQANLLSNGSFETNTGGFAPSDGFDTLAAGNTAISGWTIDGLGVDYVGNYWQAQQGQWSIDLDGTNNLGNAQGSISQSFSVTPGKNYTVTFFLAGNPDGGPAGKNLAVTVDSALQTFAFNDTGDSRGAMGYVAASFGFTATTPTELLDFQSLTPGFFGPVIDNVDVELSNGGGHTVPEPASLGLLLVSLTGTFGFSFYRWKRAATI